MEDIAKSDPGFHSREGCPEARMDAVAESDVRIGRASDVKFVRLGELSRVTVGGADHGEDQFPRWNFLAMHLGFPERSAHEPLERGTISQDLFDGAGKQFGRCPQSGVALSRAS